MIDYTRLPYTEQLLFQRHLQRQRSAAVTQPFTPGGPVPAAVVIPPAALAAGSTALPPTASPEGLSLEKWLLYGLLLAGTGLLAYGFYQYFSTPPAYHTRRKEED